MASRLHQKCPSASILIIEAGLDASKHPMSVDSVPIPVFQHSDLEWDYKMVPQKHLGNKNCSADAGKVVGGGSAINACTCSPTHFHVTAVDGPRRLVPRRQERLRYMESCWMMRGGPMRGCSLTFARRRLITPLTLIPTTMASREGCIQLVSHHLDVIILSEKW